MRRREIGRAMAPEASICAGSPSTVNNCHSCASAFHSRFSREARFASAGAHNAGFFRNSRRKHSHPTSWTDSPGHSDLGACLTRENPNGEGTDSACLQPRASCSFPYVGFNSASIPAAHESTLFGTESVFPTRAPPARSLERLTAAPSSSRIATPHRRSRSASSRIRNPSSGSGCQARIRGRSHCGGHGIRPQERDGRRFGRLYYAFVFA